MKMKKLINKYQSGDKLVEKYKYGIPTAEETDNRLYQSSFGTMLPEVKVTAKGDPRKVNNDYYKAHSRARAKLQNRVADRTDYAYLNPTNILEYTPVIGDALDAAHITNDVSNKNYLAAGIGAGMFLLPNIVEKPLKKVVKPISKWTPEQWTAAQDAAIAKGDMAEAQRLRDLHFKVSAPNTQLPGNYYRSERGDKLWNVFDMSRAGANGSRIGKGIYFFNDANAVKNYGDDIRRFYVNSNKVVEDIPGPKLFGMSESTISKFKNHKIPALRKSAENIEGADAIHGIDESWGEPLDEWVVKNSNQIKLADAVTYDNNGVRIPLGERDNFNISDIRYSLLPFILGSAYIGESQK